ncbi:unnamed protein product [Absidia cylindrospora]
MSFSPTSSYPTPVATAITSPPTKPFVDKNSQKIRSVVHVAQPIPVKMAISRYMSSATPPTSSSSTSATPTDTVKVTEAAATTAGRGSSGVVGAGNGSSGTSYPRFVVQSQAPSSLSLPQQQPPHFDTNITSLSSFFDRKQTSSSPLATAGMTTTTSSDKTVTTTTVASQPKLDIISSPHDNNKSNSIPIVGIPCLVKQQQQPPPSSSSSTTTTTIKPISSDEIINPSSITSYPSTTPKMSSTTTAQSPNDSAPDASVWLSTLNALKDQIQQIQQERHQEKLAYLAKEMERRALEQKMLDEIQKTGQQLAFFSQQLKDQEEDQQHHTRYRSKSAERQSSVDSNKGTSRTKGLHQRRPHSFTSSSSATTSLPISPIHQQQQNDYHSAIEDESDHNGPSKVKHKQNRKTHHRRHHGTRGSLSSSSSNDTSDSEHDNALQQQSHRSRHQHKERSPTRPHVPGPSSRQRHSPTLPPHYSWSHPNYYYTHPPPPHHQQHPFILPPPPPPPTRLYGNQQQQQSAPPISSYTFPPTSSLSSRDKRRHPSFVSSNNSLSSQQPPPPSTSSSSSLQPQDQPPPPNSHSSSGSATRFRTGPASAPTYPHHLQRHMPPPPSFHPSYLPFHPNHGDNPGLFM